MNLDKITHFFKKIIDNVSLNPLTRKKTKKQNKSKTVKICTVK